MAKITDYPSITTIDANTILLADGLSGTGKILASDMAKYALETYAGSTLAGSAQSVKNAFSNILNGDAYSLHGGTVVEANTDLDTLTTPGNYYSWDSINVVNGPTTVRASFTLKVEAAAGQADERYVRQTLMYYNSHIVYERYRVASGWQAWTRYALGIDIDRADRLYLGPDDVSIPNNSDFNDYKTAGTYVINAGSQMATMTNAPVSDIGGRLDVRYILKTNAADADSAKRLFQIFTGNNSSRPQWTRFFNGSSWFPWQKLPTREEVDALSTRIVGASYSTLADLYAAGIATSGYKVAVVSSSVASALSGDAVPTSSRVLMFKVDANVVDVLCFALATGAVYLARLTGGEVTKSYVVYREPSLAGAFTPRFSVSSSGKTITVPSSMRAVLIVTDADVANSGLYFVSTSTAGKATIRTVAESEELVSDVSTTGQLTLSTKNSNKTLGCIFFCTNANVPTV